MTPSTPKLIEIRGALDVLQRIFSILRTLESTEVPDINAELDRAIAIGTELSAALTRARNAA